MSSIRVTRLRSSRGSRRWLGTGTRTRRPSGGEGSERPAASASKSVATGSADRGHIRASPFSGCHAPFMATGKANDPLAHPRAETEHVRSAAGRRLRPSGIAPAPSSNGRADRGGDAAIFASRKRDISRLVQKSLGNLRQARRSTRAPRSQSLPSSLSAMASRIRLIAG
jgi:hypothetical protein